MSAMQRPQRETFTLNDILITDELSQRSPQSPNWQAQSLAMQTLARQLVNQPEMMLPTLVEKVLNLCNASSAGISLLETTADGSEVFRPIVLAGIAPQVGSTTHRDHPCGVCLARGTPVLFSYPERYFTYLGAANTPIVEGLVLPLIAENRAFGTLWIMSHDEARHFDAEDVRVMTSLADFALALLLKERQNQELLLANARLEAEITERHKTEESALESVAQFRAIANLVPTLLWRNDTEGNTSWYNQRWLDYTGQTIELAQGNGWLEVIHPDDRALTLANFQNAVDEGQTLRQEHRIRSTDGNYRWFLIQTHPVFNSSGRIIQWFGAATDIHEQRVALEALRQSQERFRAIVAQATVGIAQTAAGRFTYVNDRFCDLTGRNREDLLGTLEGDITHPDESDRYLHLLDRMYATGEPFVVDKRYVRPDGASVLVLNSVSPLHDTNGRITGGFATSIDISDRKRTEDEHKQAQVALRESEEKYRTLFESIGEAFCLLEILYDETGEPFDLRYHDTNRVFTRQTGVLNAEGKTAHELIPNLEPFWIETYARVVQTGEPVRFENYVQGTDRWFNVDASRVGPEGSRTVAVVFNDISARKRSEANLSFLAETSADFAPLLSAEKIMERIGKRLADFLNLSRCNFSVVDEEADRIECIYAWQSDDSMPNLLGAHRISAFLNEEGRQHYAAGKLSVINDTRTSSMLNLTFEMWDELGYGSIVDAPYLKDGRWEFLLTIARSEAGEWREDQVDLIRELAERIYIRIERSRAESALRVSEEKYRSLFESIDEGVATIEVLFDEQDKAIDYRFLEINPAHEVMSRVGRDVVGKRIREVMPAIEESAIERVGRVALTGEPIRFEDYVSALNRWFDVYLARVGSEGSRTVATVFNNITERKRMEANLAFLAEVSQDLLAVASIGETMDALGAKIGGHFNVWRCAFVEIDEAADEAVCQSYSHRADLPSVVGIYRIAEFFTDDDFLRTLRAGEAFVTRDRDADSRVDAKNLAALNIASFIAIPIIRARQLQFVFCIYDSEVRDWQGDEIELMRELTTSIWTRLERAHAESALRLSEEKYRRLFDSIDEGYCVIEMHIEPGEPLDYRFIVTNRAFEQQSTLVNAQGKWMRELRPNHEESWFEIYRDVALTGEPVRFEHGGKELGDRWFTLYAFRIGEPNQRQVAVLFNDITERKQAEQAKTVFFSNISHEFRTPLTLLLSPLQDALNDRAHPLSPIQQSQLQLAHRNAIRLLKLVNTLLDASRIEALRIQAVYEPTDLATFTIELASAFDSAIRQAGLCLVLDCPPLQEPVYVDRSMWEKIVLNLLSNAFKFTFAGEITIRLTLVSERVELTVQDTGIGIKAAELPRLFERFYQVKEARGRSFEGSGIGLSLVQELVRLHGGTITVSSTQGEGSCFKVSIPTGFAHLPSQEISLPQTFSPTAAHVTAYVEEALGWLPEEGTRDWRLEARREHRGQEAFLPQNPHLTQNPHFSFSPQPLTPSPSPARILLVDDNADMLAYLKQLLSQRWQVETAANGAVALTQIQQQPPDLILSDVMMPQLDGLQLLAKLRADPQTKSIPIILLSARATEEATVEGLEALADDYLIKPFSARELLARVQTHLQLARLRFEQSANRFKDEFLMTVTHELLAPLAAILGWARLLQTKPFDSSTMSRALLAIERNATIEAKLVKDLLDVSSILSGKLCLQLQRVDLIPLVKEVVTTLHPSAQVKEIQLIEILPAEACELTVLGDPNRLRQILANLLDNAIKFTRQGGTVEISLARVGSREHRAHEQVRIHHSPFTTHHSYAQIQIKDTGIGIAPEFIRYIFDRFSQAEVPSRHSPGGVGIGLAIARLLVELHKGIIEVASEGEGLGATFTVKLPSITSA